MSTLSIRVDDQDKRRFENFCSQVGLTASSAVNLFIKAALRENKIPFEIVAPDPFYSPSNIAFLKEGIQQLNAGKGTVHELLEDDE